MCLKNYCCQIHIYSGNAGSTSGPSIALTDDSNISGDDDYGCFHYVVSNISRYPRPNNVFICPNIYEPLTKLTVWVENTAWWGNPMIEVSTNGTWYQDTAVSQFMPSTGYVRLPFYTVSAI